MAGLSEPPEESVDSTAEATASPPAGRAPETSPPSAPEVDSSEPPAPSFVLWMVLALASAMVCQGWLTGLPALVLTTMARGDWLRGAREASRGKMRVAKVLTISGVVVGLGLLGYVFLAVMLNETLPPPSY